MQNIIHVLRSIKCILFFLNHRPFLKFPERQKALHSLLLPDSLETDAISTASSIRCRTRGWFAFDPASFCEKNSDLTRCYRRQKGFQLSLWREIMITL